MKNIVRKIITFIMALFLIISRPNKVLIILKWVLKDVEANGTISTNELVDKIFMFCELYSGVKFYPYQEQFSRRIIRSVLDNDGAELTGLFARQMGKTETVASTVGGLEIILPKLANMPMFAGDKRLDMFKEGFMVGIFAPSLRQAQTNYNRMRKRMQSKSAQAVLADPDFGYKFSTSNGQTVALTNGSFATAISASDGANIEGEGFHLIVLEECQDISDFKIKKSIIPMGSAFNATVVKIGTPTTFKGDFYESIKRNVRDYKTGFIKLKAHFQYDYKVGMKYNPKYAKYVESQKHKLGEHSDEFRMSYGLEWILERGMFLDIDKFERTNGGDFERLSYDKEHTYVAGIDLAKKGDSTVVSMVEVDWDTPVIREENTDEETGEIEVFTAYNTRLRDWLELTGDDYETQYYTIMDYLSHFNVKRIMIDATKEEGMADRLKANLKCEVVACVFSQQFKSAMYKHLDSEFKSGRFQYPKGDATRETTEYLKFIEQFGDLQKEYRGQLMICAHPNVRGAHDDYPDSCGLAVYGAREEGETSTVETTNNNPFSVASANKSRYQNRNRITGRRR